MTTIHATGTSEAYYPAERALISARISVSSRDRHESIEQATRAHNEAVRRAVQLRESGDASWYSAEPITTWAQKSYAEGSGNTVVIEYVTSSRVRVKLSNLSIVSQIVEEFAANGHETDVTWSLTERSRKEYERQVRKEAVFAARAIADDYADALGEAVAAVVSISDTRAHEAPLRSRFMSADAAGSADVTVAEITVSATVSGVYETA